jgi:hypothetical protein
VAAGHGMVELLTRLRDERARGGPPSRGGLRTPRWTLIALYRALNAYQHEVPQRRDGLFVARHAIEAAHGVGVADLTMAALSEMRAEIFGEMELG